MKYIETIREILLSHCFLTNLFYVPPTVEMRIPPWEFRIARPK